jgi:hypothetical protein
MNTQNSASNVLNLGYFKSKLITDIKTKHYIINFIYNTVNVYNYRYKIIDNVDILGEIKQNKENMYVIPHFQGYNFYMIFLKYDNLNMAVLVDKKNIKYKKEQVNIRDINMYTMNVRCHQDMYKNTFFDGRIIKKNEENIFLIQDCYLLEDNKLFTERMDSKFKTVDDYLGNKLYDKNININVIKLYNLDKISEVAEKMKLTDYVINGFIFLPSRSGINYIYVNNLEVDQLKSELPKVKQTYDKDTFLIKKTLMREVFDVIDIDTEKRLGICYIKDIKQSHEMRNLFKDTIFHRMKCVYNEKFKKYQPKCLVTDVTEA